MENSGKNESDNIIAVEGVVLDREGHVLHDPRHGAAAHTKFDKNFKVAWGAPGSMSLVPKVLIGIFFGALLVLGLTVAGIALGIFLVGLIGRLFLKTKRR